MKVTLNNTDVEITKENLASLLTSKINLKQKEGNDDPFVIADLGDVVHKYKVWVNSLPRVEPFYAVKCNDNTAVLETLSALGVGFDCASKAEIKKILGLKVSPSRIIYANPCKQTSHIRYATQKNVSLMTFDNESELHKVKAECPDAKLVLRILPPDESKSQCQLGMKFGVDPRHAPKLLSRARQLDLNVVGVSFHVGSGCSDPTAFTAAVASARTVFDMGANAGYHFDLLDIGGGFPGQNAQKLFFEEICHGLRQALDTYFPESFGVRIIAEPGRYFVASAFTLAVNIISKRVECRDLNESGEESALTADDEPAFRYYVNDGVYGSFNCLLYDHAIVEPKLVNSQDKGETKYTSSVWGPTCDGLDCINKEVMLPELDSDDWLVYHDMGAYTLAAASTFNGMPKPRCYYVMQDQHWVQLKGAGNGAATACITHPLMKTGMAAAATIVDGDNNNQLAIELASSPA